MWKRRLPILLAAVVTSAIAEDAGYELRLASSVEAARLTLMPVIAAPAGRQLRYEMVSTKQGAAGMSNTRQSGGVVVGADGSARLSSLSLGVGPDDRYVVTVKVFDGARLVAEDVLRYP
jgi:hypothetical protein